MPEDRIEDHRLREYREWAERCFKAVDGKPLTVVRVNPNYTGPGDMKPFDDSVTSAVKTPTPADRGAPAKVVNFPMAERPESDYVRLFKEIEKLHHQLNSINTEKAYYQERLVQMAGELRQTQAQNVELRQELHRIKDEFEAKLLKAAWGLFVAWLKRLIPWGK